MGHDRPLGRRVVVPQDVVGGLCLVNALYPGDRRLTARVSAWLADRHHPAAAAWVAEFPDRFLDALEYGFDVACDRVYFPRLADRRALRPSTSRSVAGAIVRATAAPWRPRAPIA